MQIEDQEFEQMLRFFKVLADRSRLKMLGYLAEREYTVKELATVLELSEPTVSQHLTMMKIQGVVEMRQQGTAHYYRMKQEDIHALLRQFKPKAYAEGPDFADNSSYERHVLNTYFENGRIKQIPMQRKKQLVILHHLLREFQPGTRYHELEVNEILKRFHPDCATLRRQLVDNRLMARDKNIYWRLDENSPGRPSASETAQNQEEMDGETSN